MPVTAKLSRKFYDQFGDEIANELVDWFNMVDLTYRTELRDLNDRNFALFDARFERRLAEQTAILRREIADQGAAIRGEVTESGAAIRREMAEQVAALRVEMAEQGAAIRGEMAEQGAAIRGEVAQLGVVLRAEMVAQSRWIMGLWAAQITAFIGTIIIVLQSR